LVCPRQNLKLPKSRTTIEQRVQTVHFSDHSTFLVPILL
ncbi:hypothetical protein RRG08_018141, partial [Elysia crispata]